MLVLLMVPSSKSLRITKMRSKYAAVKKNTWDKIDGAGGRRRPGRR